MNNSFCQKKILFAGAVRDCEFFLPSILSAMENLESIFSEIAYLFVENDSIDATKKILNQWGKNKNAFKLISLDGVGSIPIRTLRIEFARNVYLEFLKQDEQLKNFDYLVVLDMDDVNSQGIDANKLIEAIDFLEKEESRAAIFANQLGTYYDMWALRHPDLCPNDVWEEVLSCVNDEKISDQQAFEKTFVRRLFSLSPNDDYVEVDSAFGGLGIYKIPYVIKNKNSYLGSAVKVRLSEQGNPVIYRWQSCEHVHFNLGIKNLGGKLFIKPDLINSYNNGVNFNPSFFREIIF